MVHVRRLLGQWLASETNTDCNRAVIPDYVLHYHCSDFTPSACASPECVRCAAWVPEWAEHLGGPQGLPLAAEDGKDQVADHKAVPAWVIVTQMVAHLVEGGCSLAVAGSSAGGRDAGTVAGAVAGGALAASAASR